MIAAIMFNISVDIKPENCLLSCDGVLKIADFTDVKKLTGNITYII